MDDDPLIRTALARLLARRAEVTVVADADEARRHLAAAPVDVLLTDIDLGVSDGRDLADAAVVVRPEVRVVLMTGSASVSTRWRVLTKPISVDTLFEALGLEGDATSRNRSSG